MQDNTADARFWDWAAPKYARHQINDMPGYERTLARIGELLKATDTVLEIGCGTGTTALRLAPRVRRIVATDISAEMISIARQKAVASGCGNIEFGVGDALQAPGGEGSYDAVLALNLLHLVRDRPAVLERMLRLLKPGGLIVSKTPCLSEMNVLIRLAVPIAQWLGKAPYVSFLTADGLEAEIAAVGLVVTERARHGSKRKDPRIFIVALRPDISG